MVAVRLEDFGGMAPIRADRLLPDNMAGFAANVDLESGGIRPIQLPTRIHQFLGAAVQRAIRVPDPDGSGEAWLGFASRNARFFPSPLTNDAFNRHVWIDNNGPGSAQRLVQNTYARIASGDPAYLLGVPAATATITVTPSGGASPVVSRAYVFTLVNQFGEEGQPSPPVTASGNISGTWTISGLALPGGVDAAARGITKYRIYRTITGATGTVFYRVADVTLPTATYADTRTDTVVASEGLVLESASWREPEAMEGFIELPGGFFAGWNKRTVFFSEPYRPWAWPAEYILSTNYEVVGAGVANGTLILFTTARPVIMSGTRPANIQIIESDSAEPCYTPNSVVTAPEGVYFVGRTGLFLASQGSLTNLTKNLISQSDWRASYLPANLAMAKLNDTQFVVLSTAGFGFVMDLSNSRTALIRIENLNLVDSVWNDPYTGEVHLVCENWVYQWQAVGAPLAVGQWRSKIFQLPQPVNFGAVVVTFSSDAAAILAQPQIPSVFTIPPPAVPGGPWLDAVAIPNYALPNTVRPNQGVSGGAMPEGITDGEPVVVPAGAPVFGTTGNAYLYLTRSHSAGAVRLVEDPVEYVPPAAPETADTVVGALGWPDWFGFRLSDPSPNTDLALASGEAARLAVRYLVSGVAEPQTAWEGFVRDGEQIRPASGFKADTWWVDIITRVPVLRVQIAETGKEIAKV